MNNSPEPAGSQPDHLDQIAEAKEVFETFSGKKLDLPDDNENFPLSLNKEAQGAVTTCLLYAEGLEDLLIKLKENDLTEVINAFNSDGIFSKMFCPGEFNKGQMPLYFLRGNPAIAYTPALREAFVGMITTLKHVSDLMIEREEEILMLLYEIKEVDSIETDCIESRIIGFFSRDCRAVDNTYAMICTPTWTEKSTREQVKETV